MKSLTNRRAVQHVKITIFCLKSQTEGRRGWWPATGKGEVGMWGRTPLPFALLPNNGASATPGNPFLDSPA